MRAGRIAHPDNKNGVETVAPSAVAAPGETLNDPDAVPQVDHDDGLVDHGSLAQVGLGVLGPRHRVPARIASVFSPVFARCSSRMLSGIGFTVPTECFRGASAALIGWRPPAALRVVRPGPGDLRCMGDGRTCMRDDADEVEQLRAALVRRPVIDLAKGVLMTLRRCPPETAFTELVLVSSHHNVKVHDLAGCLVDMISAGDRNGFTTRWPAQTQQAVLLTWGHILVDADPQSR